MVASSPTKSEADKENALGGGGDDEPTEFAPPKSEADEENALGGRGDDEPTEFTPPNEEGGQNITAAVQAAVQVAVQAASSAVTTRHENICDLDSMKDSVWFLFPDRNRRLSQFWLLIILASVIATAGVANDSTATVIGAMIVAPLMTPILGTMLAIVLTDTPNFWFSLLHVLAGAGSAILVGYLYGLGLDDDTISKENNINVAGRVEPKINDLISALATGAVGTIALVRRDIAGSLPGVAIAISLVPPLCVVGLTLSSGDGEDAAGALLLFCTNFASIMVVGVAVMHFYRITLMARRRRARYRSTAILVFVLLLGVVAVPLTFTSINISKKNDIENCLQDEINQRFAEAQIGWFVSIVVARAKGGNFGQNFDARVTVVGEPPFPTADEIRPDNNLKELCDVDAISVFFVPVYDLEL